MVYGIQVTNPLNLKSPSTIILSTINAFPSRYRINKCFRICRSRVPVNGFRIAGFHNPAFFHHHHPVAEIADNRKIMGNKYGGKTKFPLQVIDQVQHLGLHTHIQCRHGFIKYNEIRIQGKRPGNHNPLPLPPGKFMGIPVKIFRPRSTFCKSSITFFFL